MASEAELCEDVRGTRYDPNGKYECENRAKWKTANGSKLCGRHIRHRGRVTPIED